jgi:uncharacterized protein YcbK (DUF882 family)
MKLTNNFWLKEFNCKDGTIVPERLIGNVQLLAEQLQTLRDVIGEPIQINSAYRHGAYNQSIGGSKNSQHILAKAADIVVGEGFTPKIIVGTIEALIASGEMMEGGLGLYDNFVHYDIRGVRARWNFSTK